MRLRGITGPEELPVLVEIWRGSVLATHDFLAPEHREEIETALLDHYLPAVQITVAERDDRVLGFSGVHGQSLEMLFVAAEARGTGLGTALLRQAIDDQGVTAVDVNEQNGQALGYYLRAGFTVNGRSETDDEGRPYPLLHLRLDT